MLPAPMVVGAAVLVGTTSWQIDRAGVPTWSSALAALFSVCGEELDGRKERRRVRYVKVGAPAEIVTLGQWEELGGFAAS